MRNLLSHVFKKNRDIAATLVRSIFAQNSEDAARVQFAAVYEKLECAGLDKAADVFGDAREDLLAYTILPPSSGNKYGLTTRRSN